MDEHLNFEEKSTANQSKSDNIINGMDARTTTMDDKSTTNKNPTNTRHVTRRRKTYKTQSSKEEDCVQEQINTSQQTEVNKFNLLGSVEEQAGNNFLRQPQSPDRYTVWSNT